MRRSRQRKCLALADALQRATSRMCKCLTADQVVRKRSKCALIGPDISINWRLQVPDGGPAGEETALHVH